MFHKAWFIFIQILKISVYHLIPVVSTTLFFIFLCGGWVTPLQAYIYLGIVVGCSMLLAIATIYGK